MKSILTAFFSILFINGFAQNLQTVTDQGTSTNREIQFRSGENPNKYVFVGGYPGRARIGAYDITTGFDNLIIEANNIGIGINNPVQKLSVAGNIFSSVGSNEGASLILENPSKNVNNAGYRWMFYNMTGPYGNSLQFWNYNQDNSVMGPKFTITDNGNVLIGKNTQGNSGYILDVNGKARANEIVVNTTGADFVFEPGYKLTDLNELEKFVKTNKHLPEIPTAKEMKENGVSLGELNIKLLQKVEELTLHLIEKDKQLDNQNTKVNDLESRLARQEKMLSEMLKKMK